MYYLLLLLGVMLFLSFVAWRYPSRRAVATHAADRPQQASPWIESAAEVFARLLKGPRNEEQPCLSPIDCVRTGRCAGHCGLR